MGEMPSNRLEAYMPMSDLEGKRDFNFQDVRGLKILNTTGHKVGTVKEIFVDPNTLEPHFAFLAYEKFMNRNMKHYLVPWHELLIGQDYVQTRWTEDRLTHETEAEQKRNLAKHGGPAEASSGPLATGSETVRSGDLETSAAMSPERDMTEDLEDTGTPVGSGAV